MSDARQRLIRDVGDAVQQYQRSTQSLDDAICRRLGLNPADLRCLDWLVDGPKTAGEISAATGIRPAATTALIDRLARKGFVRRIRGETDRRQVLVEMTPEGHSRTYELYAPLVADGQHIMADYSDDRLQMMVDVLAAMREVTDRYRRRLLDRS